MLASEFQAALESAIEAKSAAVKDLKDAQKLSKKEIDDLKGAAADKQKEYDEELIAQLEKQKALLSDSFKDRIEDLETAVRDSQAAAALREKSEAGVREELAAALSALEFQNNNNDTSLRDFNAVTTKYESVQETVLELTATIADHDEKASKRIQALSEERAALEAQVDESQLKCSSLTAEVENLQFMVTDLESKTAATSTDLEHQDEVRQERDGLQRENSKLAKELQILKAAMAALEKSDAEAATQRDESLSIITALLAENKVQLSSTLLENKESEERCQSLSYEVETLKAQVVKDDDMSGASKEESDERNHQMLLQRDALLTKCAQLQDELSALQNQAEEGSDMRSRSDENEMELEIDNLRAQVLEMQDRLQVKEEQLDAVHRAADASSEDIQRELETLKKALIAKELLERAHSADSLNESSGRNVLAEEESSARVLELENTVARQLDEIKVLKSSVQDSEAKYLTGVSDLSILTEEINASVTVVLERDTTVENLIAEISTLKASLKDVSSLLETEKITVTESEDSIAKLQSDYEAVNSKNNSLEKSLEAAVYSKINADKLLQKAIEDAEAARLFAENLLTQTIGEDDNRTGIETALKVSLESAARAHKEAIASLRSELQQAIEEKVRAENDLEEAFSAKCAGELLLKSDLQEAVQAKETALEGRNKAVEELSKSLNNLKREKELSSSSESRIEEVEANAEMEIITQLSRQSSIISSSFKNQIEELEIAAQALRDEIAEHAKGEQEALEQLRAVTEERDFIQKDLESAQRANMETAGTAEDHLKVALNSKMEVESELKASLESAARAHKEAIASLRSELQQAIEEKVRAENDLEEAFSAKCAGELLLKSDLQEAVQATETALAAAADALEGVKRVEDDLQEAIEGRRRAEGDLQEAVEGRRRAEGDLQEAVEVWRRAEGDLQEAVEGRRRAEGDLQEAVEGRRRAEGDLQEAVEGRRRAEDDLQEAVEGRRRAEGDLQDAFNTTAEAQKALRICEEDLKLTDKEANEAEARLISQNRAVANLEDTVQERIVENASLREELSSARTRYQKLEESFLKGEQVILDLRADLQGFVSEKDKIAAATSKQIETAMEEVEYYTKTLLSKESQLDELTTRFNMTDKELTEIKLREGEYISKLQNAQDAELRVAEAEEALSRVEEKKKRDLENLKKQNERISAVQVSILISIVSFFLFFEFSRCEPHVILDT